MIHLKLLQNGLKTKSIVIRYIYIFPGSTALLKLPSFIKFSIKNQKRIFFFSLSITKNKNVLSNFHTLRLFPALRLFRSLEYSHRDRTSCISCKLASSASSAAI